MNQKKNKPEKGSWKKLAVTGLSGIVAFCVSYSLIVPAATMDRKAASDIVDHLDEQNSEGTVTETGAKEEATPSPTPSATTVPDSANAIKAETDDYTVTLNPKDGLTLPDGATLSVNPLTENTDEYNNARTSVINRKKAEDASFDENNLGFLGFDLAVLDGNGNRFDLAGGTRRSQFS